MQSLGSCSAYVRYKCKSINFPTEAPTEVLAEAGILVRVRHGMHEEKRIAEIFLLDCSLWAVKMKRV